MNLGFNAGVSEVTLKMSSLLNKCARSQAANLYQTDLFFLPAAERHPTETTLETSIWSFVTLYITLVGFK